MIEQAFEVATEFKFDIGQALLNTNTLKGAVDQLSNASNSALSSFNYLASGLVAHLGFGSGGLLTVLQQAVGFSQQLNQDVLNFSNVIGQNMTVLTGTIGTFNDRIMTSKAILDSISDTAIKFGIPTEDLAHLTEMISNPLAKAGKLGTNFSGGIQMSRNLLLAAPSANLNPHTAAESLYRALNDKMPLHGQLFSRLAGTTDFKNAHVTTQHQLMGMDTRKKIDLLNKALETLGLNSEAVEYRMNLLSTQFTIIKNHVQRVLAPIGEAIGSSLAMVLKKVSGFLETHGKAIGASLGQFIARIFKDPKNLFIGLQQISHLGADFRKALHFTEIVTILSFVIKLLADLGLIRGGMIAFLGRSLMSLGSGIASLAGMVPWLKVFAQVLSILRYTLFTVMPIFLGFLALFQALSRAKATARIDDVEALAALAPRVTAITLKYKLFIDRLLTPWNKLVDAWAKGLEWIFRWSIYTEIFVKLLELAAPVMDKLSMAMLNLMGICKGITYVVFGMMTSTSGFNWKTMKKNFQMGVDSFKNNNEDLYNADGTAKVSNVVNNNYINARFDLKEQLEPDRIAFAVTDHLKKLALNPRQSRGSSFSGPFSGSVDVAGAR